MRFLPENFTRWLAISFAYERYTTNLASTFVTVNPPHTVGKVDFFNVTSFKYIYTVDMEPEEEPEKEPEEEPEKIQFTKYV
jgi:hypothetical protein